MNKIHLTVAALLVVIGFVFTFTLMNFELEDKDVPGRDRPTGFNSGEYLENEIIRDNGWAIVPKKERGERVYWFIAPNEGDISPGVFKKTIHDGNDGRQFTLVSECEAAKPVCDRLMEEFKELAARYD